jgi:MoaA/NifB/PqqE/SkfB family radical SAM enzyme
MKFPLRLTLDLWRARLFGASDGADGVAAPIFHLPAAWLPALHENGFEHGADGDSHSAADSVRTAAKTKAPVLWIGGGEPLDHAEVGRVAFALNARGRNVFIHTDGQRLRQRIHEFRPGDRLFLAVELAGREAFHDRSVGKTGAFRRVIEGIRAAKLSGFHVCAHVNVTDKTEPCETGELFEFLDRYDVDGYIVSSGGLAHAIPSAAYQDKLEELRGFVRCSRWENFSRLLETSYAGRAVKQEASTVATALPSQVDSEALEETA